MKAKINSKTRAIIISSPHNPTGAVLSQHDIEQLKSVVAGTEIIIISDEVYEHLIFDDKPHLSMLKYPELRGRSFVCFSFGKTYHCTGWKMGYCIVPEAMMRNSGKYTSSIVLPATARYSMCWPNFKDDEEHYLQLGKQIQQKRDYFAEQMKQTRFTPIPSYGSYFQLYSYKTTDEPEFDFAVRLTKEAGVAKYLFLHFT